MTFIHQQTDWPDFKWDAHSLPQLLADVRNTQGRLLGRMDGLGLQLRAQATLTTLTADVTKSSAIEGEFLNQEQVRSSIARKLGLNVAGMVSSSRDIDGVVEMMLDATQNFQQPLSSERLFCMAGSSFSHRKKRNGSYHRGELAHGGIWAHAGGLRSHREGACPF